MQTSSDWVSKSTYFLGTGPKEYYYTLWRQLVIRAVPGTNIGGCYYYYLGNLSHEYEPAVAKATERTGQTHWEQFDVSDYKRTNSALPDLDKSPDEITFTFGKYIGQSLGHVLEIDLGYVLFLALKSDWQPSQSKHAKVLNYIRAMFRAQAQQAETERKEKIAAERAARDAARADLPAFEGRVEITGAVISTKEQESQFGVTWKMLVEHQDGWKVWGTIPSGINPEKGDKVSFTAKIEKSPSDPKFGFFSRPTKPTITRPEPVEA